MKVSFLLGKTSFSDAFPVNACDDSMVDVDKLKIRDSQLWKMRTFTSYKCPPLPKAEGSDEAKITKKRN
ncbi:unnamed protein product [Rhizophagus irregularis]|nr:unnamed protein product [Rhizophagus irregularis]CAB5350046.1 unnamed protein product [Rhizophagus irregularis]